MPIRACAMCYWGEGFVLGPNITDGMPDENIRPAFAATSRAMALRDGASDLEQALIEALAKRYAVGADADLLAMDVAFAGAMSGVVERFPDEPTVLARKPDRCAR